MIVPTLLALLAVINLYGFVVMADHFRCYWKYVAGAPTNSGFSRHCLAEKKKVDDMHARYECLEDQMVADWGYLDTYKLEFATPCGGDGYALQGMKCQGKSIFAVCNASALPEDKEKFYCLYLYAQDDCEWPLTFEKYEDLPKHVDIWHI